MAGERTRDIKRINIRITPEGKSARTLTSLFDWDSGESPEKVIKRDPDVKGNVHLRKIADKSRQPTITVKVGSQDEKFLDDLADTSTSFSIAVVDESNEQYAKEHTGKECYITKVPADPYREGDNRTYSLICSEFKTKSI